MATSADFKDFVLECLEALCLQKCSFSARKMFGEYCIYMHKNGDKLPLFLLCNNQVFIKKHKFLSESLKDSATGVPFVGAKEWYVLDIESSCVLEKVIEAVRFNL